MVAYPGRHSSFSYRRFDIFIERLRCGAVYIYGILMKKVSETENLKTILTLSLFFLILFLLFKINWAIYICAALLFLGIFDNPLAKTVSSLWLSFSEVMGKISTFIILFLIFYLFITPLAFLWRIFNKKDASHFLKDNSDSLFTVVKKTFSKDYFEKTW